MPERNQPHDRFFTNIYGQPDTAEDMMIHNIPELADVIVPGSIEAVGGKLVDQQLNLLLPDLLFKAQLKIGTLGYFYILLEHKSFQQTLMAFNMLDYMMQIWKQAIQNGEPLPFIFPIVIYHGPKEWNSGTGFASMVTCPPGMERFVPNFEYYLLDLAKRDDGEIKGAIPTRVGLSIMKHIFAPNFSERFVTACKPLSEWEDRKAALNYLRYIIEYVGNTTDKMTEEQLREGVIQILPEGEKLMPTLFGNIREEGRGMGLIEGLQMGIQVSLEIKFGEEGLAFYNRINELNDINTLMNIKDAIRTGSSIADLEKYLEEN